MKQRNGFIVMKKLIGLVRPLTGYMILAIITGLLGNLCATFITVLGGVALLDVLGQSVKLTYMTAFVMLVVFALIRGFLRYAEQSFNHYIAFKLLALIRSKIFFALRKLCPAKLEGKDRGNLISLITSDVELLEVFYAHTISPIAIAVLFSVVMVLFIGSFNPIYGFISAIAYITVGIILPILMNRLGGENAVNFRNKSGELSSFVLDSMRGLDETIQYGDGENRLNQIDKKSQLLSDIEKNMKKNMGINAAVTNGVIILFDISILICAILLYEKGVVNFSGVLLPLIALMSSFGPVISLANLGSTLQNTLAAGNRVLDILEEEPLVKDILGKSEIKFQGAYANNVSFAYENENILKNFSMDIPKNKIIGIVGRSGSGKSTILKLFMRFWDVQEGELKISDKKISEINTKNLRNMESFVTQETHLFHDSIKNNLKIAKLDATDEEIEKASIHDFIMTLPKGYNTSVGELGDTLSGGERQRLGLARAFLHDAPFMLLDEPTSNLDSLNEAVILKSLYQQQDGKTVVLVSHRLSTMRIVDKVYSVENGRVS